MSSVETLLGEPVAAMSAPDCRDFWEGIAIVGGGRPFGLINGLCP